MTDAPDADDFPAKLARLESLIHKAERLPDAAARAHARELVRALLDLHAAGLERMLDHVAGAGEAGGAILDACAADEVAGGLLLLHGLHPVELEDRVLQAVEQVQPLLESHGGGVELIGIQDGFVRLRLERNSGCGSSASAMRKAVEDAITARAPDAAGIEIEGLEPAPEANGRVALPLA